LIKFDGRRLSLPSKTCCVIKSPSSRVALGGKASTTMEASKSQDGSVESASVTMQVLSEVMAQLQALRAEREADREEMRCQVQNIQAAFLTPTPTDGPTITSNMTQNGASHGTDASEQKPAKRKPTLPDPQRFDGTRKRFRAWQLEMQSKLRVDGVAIGSPSDQFAYIYARLDQIPQSMAAAFFERGGPDGRFDPDMFMQYLVSCYADPNAEQRALARLETMRQGSKESFAAFLPKFEKELAESGGATWADSVRINTLKRVINQELRTHLAGQLSLPREYPAFVNALQTLGANLEDLRFYNQHTNNKNSDAKSPSNDHPHGQKLRSPVSTPVAVTAPPSVHEDRMDWEPVKASRVTDVGKPQGRNHFVPLEERTCYECGKLGHIAAHCSKNKRQQRQKNVRVEEKTKSSRAKHQEPAESSHDEASDEYSENE
jgi:hypothetical protein